MIFHSKFCSLSNLVNTGELTSLDSIHYVVSDSDDLHLGDRFFLQCIADKMNENEQRGRSTTVVLTIARDVNRSILLHPNLIVASLNWSSRMILFPEEMIRLSMKKIGAVGSVFQVKGEQNTIVFCPEIRSSKVRIFGMEKRFVKILKLFKEEGLKVLYFGTEWDSAAEIYKDFVDGNVSGLIECEKILDGKNVFAFLGFDNYWMHVANSKGKRCYIVQRRKFLRVNLINHVSSLNRISSQNNLTYI